MGKKSRRVKNPPAASAGAVADQGGVYTSDGPSQEEINSVQTSSLSLQRKLDQLTEMALKNDRAGFVSQFVPLDLSEADSQAYLKDLTTEPEAESQWTNLASEIAAISAGKGVERIEGDQVTQAVFCFVHPLLQNCDREVSFVCTNGEWRAEG